MQATYLAVHLNVLLVLLCKAVFPGLGLVIINSGAWFYFLKYRTGLGPTIRKTIVIYCIVALIKYSWLSLECFYKWVDLGGVREFNLTWWFSFVL